MKIIFLVSRYSPFLDLGFLFYGLFAINASVDTCSTAIKVHAFMFGSSICISDAIFTVRTWSVWQRGRGFTIGLTVLFIVTWSTCMAFVGIFIFSLRNILSPYPWTTGCFIIGGNASVFIAFCVLFMAYNAVTFALMAIRGYNAYRSGGQSNLVKVVCQDGISYYLYALALAFTDLILVLQLPHEYINLMVS
ncbi:hypothetical protein BDQ12DRAFT_730083 [Crucibulum laeve]|uniref:G-protein coupled receptors family 1 profile domain-containing protein n=1 Tax=Crucibulum laeve TaxID=68775 RepID=A0A5C3LE61_9AGAR|nr:hypothetical protein BDQ12DRAFT_730083 [Crucibulum laeve]